MITFFKNKIDFYSKKFKIDLNYFLSSGFWTSSYLIVDLFFGFLLSLILIKYLTLDDLGLWYWYLSVFGMFGIFTLTGFNIIIRKLFLDRKYSFFKNLLYLRILVSLIGSLVLLLCSVLIYLTLVPYSLDWRIFIVLALALPISNLRFYVDYLYSKDRFATISIQAIVKYILYYSSTIILLVLKIDLIYILISFLLIQYLIDLIFTLYYYKSILNSSSKNLTLKDKSSFKLGFNLSFSDILIIIQNQFDKLIIPIMLSIQSLGIYGMSLIIPMSISSLNKKLVNNLFFKKINNISIIELNKIIFKNIFYILMMYVCYFFVLLGISYILFKYYLNIGDLLFDVLFFSSFILFVSFFSIFSEIYKKAVESRLKTIYLIKFELLATFLVIVSSVILIYLIGLLGAILSKFVLEIIKLIYFYFVSKKLD